MVILSSVAFKMIGLLLMTAIAYLWLSRIDRQGLFVFLFLFFIVIAGYIVIEAAREPPSEMSAAEKKQISLEQPVFAAWYNDYKKDIDRIDMHWQQYHKTLKLFSADEISTETVQSRLAELRQETQKMKDQYAQMKPPQELSELNFALTGAIIGKTMRFTAQQDKVLQLTIQVIGQPDFKIVPHDTQVNRLAKIMILENPINLDIAAEVLQIRDALTMKNE